ncbi:MAG: adenine deaminase [Deltaproteobacteria bacterium]|jgi:adenine deaminase|nr:adenine deaminase [Deltaproteobacteria bacterium]
MRKLLAASRGKARCDLVIRGGRVANVFSLEYEELDIAVSGGIIVGAGRGYHGKKEVDAHNAVLMPGMIDGHLHIESTLLAPGGFASVVVPAGTTTVMCDPHEIANVCGLPGIEFMCREARRTPLDAFFAAPSCVPASAYETPRCKIDSTLLKECYAQGLCSHLGEMMNFPGVINGEAEVWNILAASQGLVKTGHAPGVSGRDLCAYLLSGCDSDHESNYVEEAREKLRRGMWVMLREGVMERNLDSLLELLLEDEARYSRFMAVSDDISAERILTDGHLDHLVRKMIKKGVRPLVAAAMVSITPANYFRLWDRGAIAPGRIADIVMVSSLEECRVIRVWKRGVLAAEEGEPLFAVPEPDVCALSALRLSVHPETPLSEERLKVQAEPGKNIRVIKVIPGKVITGQLVVEPLIRGDQVVSDVERDILKLAVLERNRGTGRIALGFARGFGFKQGAIASSVAHDAHNYIAVGVDDRSILTALKFLADNRGGFAVALDDEIKQTLPLPIGGLMSALKPAGLVRALRAVEEAAAGLGGTSAHPFMALSFLSLSVIPELKLTDQGYIGILTGGRLPLFV